MNEMKRFEIGKVYFCYDSHMGYNYYYKVISRTKSFVTFLDKARNLIREKVNEAGEVEKTSKPYGIRVYASDLVNAENVEA